MPIFVMGSPQRPEITHDNGFLDRQPRRSARISDFLAYAYWRFVERTGTVVTSILPERDSHTSPSTVRVGGAAAIAGLRSPVAPAVVTGVAAGGITYVIDRLRGLPDAFRAYNHFLDATGRDYIFDFSKYLGEDRSGQAMLANATTLAKANAERIHRIVSYTEAADQIVAQEHSEQMSLERSNSLITWSGSFQMTSVKLDAGGNNPLFPYPATENWQKAIGAFPFWMSADVSVNQQANEIRYSMELTIHAEDRYNFNPGQQDIGSGVSDESNGRFEVTGLGMQFMQYGTHRQYVSWVLPILFF